MITQIEDLDEYCLCTGLSYTHTHTHTQAKLNSINCNGTTACSWKVFYNLDRLSEKDATLFIIYFCLVGSVVHTNIRAKFSSGVMILILVV